MLKSTTGWDNNKGKSGWESNGNGADAFGFNALPAGVSYRYGGFGYVGKLASFWSATARDEFSAYALDLYYNGDQASLHYSSKDLALSVRCLRPTFLLRLFLPRGQRTLLEFFRHQ